MDTDKTQKGELEKQLPELALLSVSILLEYFYTEIRLSTPAMLLLELALLSVSILLEYFY
jgi:hypothetical protein